MKASSPRSELDITTAVLITSVSGYVDAVLFLRFQIFAFAQTGNIVLLAVAAVDGGEWLRFLWPLLAYIAGLAAAEGIRAVSPAGSPTVKVILLVILVQIFAFITLAVGVPGSSETAMTTALSFIGAVRLNLFRSASGFPFMSVATSGNLMRFVQATAGIARERSSDRLRELSFTAAIVIGFFGGAIFGASMSNGSGPTLLGAAVLDSAAAITFALRTRSGSGLK